MSTTTIGRALLKACQHGSVKEANTLVPRLLAKGISKETAPPLQLAMATAAYHGHSDILRNIMSNFPKGVKPSREAWTLPFTSDMEFHRLPKEWKSSAVPDLVVTRAVEGGSVPVVQTLMDFGLEVDYMVDKVGTLLCIALCARKLDMVRFLLEKGADPNDRLWFFTPFLMKAASLPEPDIMVALLEHGAELKGSGALQGAAEAGRITAAEILLERGADVDEVFRLGLFDDESIDIKGMALHAAVKHSQEEFVHFLLARGARQDLRDGDGLTAMEVAVAEGNKKMIQLLQS
ncbi:ankyrin [Periconia macrospinosa]|uniref:Ankyrin n=1 Tax=Periconia macrospinosa TaxID=97972 RepID=A0A2V1DG77_9PLEO|nr:ankyrin [Periconia macrospinosa]